MGMKKINLQVKNCIPKLVGKIRKENWGGIYWNHEVARIDILNEVAYDILSKCDGKNNVTDIVKQINEEYEADYDLIEKDVNEYLMKTSIIGYVKGIDLPEFESKKIDVSNFGVISDADCENVLNGKGIIGTSENPLSAPLKVLIEFTKNCNLRCVHCFAEAECKVTEQGYLEGELTTEQWYKVIDNVYNAGVFDIFVSGGEALLRSDIFDILEYINSKGLGFCLLTNATLITDEVAKKLKALNCYKVEANMDGYDEKTYDMFRGVKGAFSDTVRGIKACIDNDLPIRCNVTMTKLNIGWLKEIADTAHSLGVREVCCVPLEQGGRADSNWEKLHIEDEATAQECYKEVDAYVNEKYGDDLMFIVPLDHHRSNVLNDIHNVAKRWDPNKLMPSCGAGKYHCSINPSGEVILCPTADDTIKFEPNGLLEHSLLDIWQNAQTFKDIRNSMDEKCMGCEKLFCERGCPLTMYRKYGKVYLEERKDCPTEA